MDKMISAFSSFWNTKRFYRSAKGAFIILVIVSCDRTHPIQLKVVEGLRPFISQFFIEADKRNIILPRQDLIVSIDSLPAETLAYGMTYYTHPIEVVIDKAFYLKNYATEEVKRKIQFIVFHEFGHALLNRPHIEAYSIMNSRTTDIGYYACSWSCRRELIDELFKNRKENLKSI